MRSEDASRETLPLAGQVVVITGGGQGIGRAVAHAAAHKGASVAIVDIDGNLAESAARTIGESSGSLTRSFQVDVRDEQAVEDLAYRVEDEIGSLTGWINNAGNISPGMMRKMSLSSFASVLSVHVEGCFLGMREAARRMCDNGTGGSLINVTSAAGLQGTVGQINYSAAKGAVVAMTKSAALEMGRYGIRVNAIAPIASTQMTSKVRTDETFAEEYLRRIPLGRWAEPAEIASSFCYLLSPEAAYITGQVLCMDGGMYMAS